MPACGDGHTAVRAQVRSRGGATGLLTWPPALCDARLTWVRRQAAAAAITRAWRSGAQLLAVKAVATGIVDWSAATERYYPVRRPQLTVIAPDRLAAAVRPERSPLAPAGRERHKQGL